MKKNLAKKRQSGFSLLEVLIFVSIITLFFIVAAIVATVSLRNLKSSENKIKATRYAEELMEWVRGEKEEDWEVFKSTYANHSYCFDQTHEPVDDWPARVVCTGSNPLIDGLFERELTLTLIPGSERVDATVIVSWTEGQTSPSVRIKTVLERFE